MFPVYRWILSRILGAKGGKAGLLAVAMLLAAAVDQGVWAAEADPPKKVLFLFSQSPGYPASKRFADLVENRLEQRTGRKTDVTYEYLELARYAADPNYAANLAEFLRGKYAANQPDIIVTYLDSAADFLTSHGKRVFPGVPAVLTLDEAEGVTAGGLPENYKAIVVEYDIEAAVDVILKTRPDTKRVYVVMGDSERERVVMSKFSRAVEPFAGRVEFVHLNKLPYPQLSETIRGIGGNAAILYCRFLQDSEGATFIPTEVLQEMHSVAKVPIYGTYAHYIGRGSVGGYMISRGKMAEKVAAVAAGMLQGEAAVLPAAVKFKTAEYIFDWRELQRWGIAEKSLPAGSTLSYKPPSFWETHRWKVFGALTLAPVQGMLIIALLKNRARRKKAQLERIDALQRFGTFFERSVVALAVNELPEGRFVAVNAAWEELTGYRRDETLGRTVLGLNIVSRTPDPIQFWEHVEKSSCAQQEFEARTKTGRLFRCLVSTTLVETTGGKHVLSTIIDVTDQRRLEAEMAQLDRLNLIGEMAAGIGHEVRNPLTTVRGYLQFFRGKEKFNEYKDQFGTMIEELDRANTIISEYLSLAKNKVTNLKCGNLNDLLAALFPLLQADASRAERAVELMTTPVPVLAFDEKELRQLVLNLVRNGLEATPAGGTVTIMSYREEGSIVLAVRDTGRGIPDSVVRRIGTPFVTTKENGTGLGLSVCYRVAQRHNAKIDFTTGRNGTTFFVRFRATG